VSCAATRQMTALVVVQVSLVRPIHVRVEQPHILSSQQHQSQDLTASRISKGQICCCGGFHVRSFHFNIGCEGFSVICIVGYILPKLCRNILSAKLSTRPEPEPVHTRYVLSQPEEKRSIYHSQQFRLSSDPSISPSGWPETTKSVPRKF
jgi:hypothetical protein